VGRAGRRPARGRAGPQGRQVGRRGPRPAFPGPPPPHRRRRRRGHPRALPRHRPVTAPTAAGSGVGPEPGSESAAPELHGILETVATAAPGPAVATVALRADGSATLCEGATPDTRFEIG